MDTMVKQIDAAIETHKIWKERLIVAVESGDCDINPSDVVVDNKCAFGKWLYGENIQDSERSGDSYNKVQTWHALFHKEASYVIELVREDKIDEAKLAMTEEGRRYCQVSTVLIQLLEDWKERILAGEKG
jgi:hypothetical protein